MPPNRKMGMKIDKKQEEQILYRFHQTLPLLNERQRRQYLGIEAQNLGRGGAGLISRLSGCSIQLVCRGIRELKEKELKGDPFPSSSARIRKPGGGRKPATDKYPGLLEAIKELVSAHTMGDPENPLIWCSKSLRNIQSALKIKGFTVSHEVIRRILLTSGYSLQLNRKTMEGGDHPDRDAQFEYINEQAKDFLSKGEPVISVDCKKKELIGNYVNRGQEWTEVRHPVEVNVYDFVDKTNGKASPYGVYDTGRNTGWISVGISSDTACFAVSTIRDWWDEEGRKTYPETGRLYINADGGGSNGSRNMLWKEQLQGFSNDTGLEIHVSHFPPGTSKWNKIEHRLFCFISKNWRGRPLTSLAVIINLINATTTKGGLTVKAKLNQTEYKTGLKISKKQSEKWNIVRNDFHGEWNYIIKPNS